jgi:hypothetical protein
MKRALPLVLFAVILSCGGSATIGGNGGGTHGAGGGSAAGGSGGSSGGGGSGSGGGQGGGTGGGAACAALCQTPKVCTPADRCLDVGACVDSFDCSAGYTCGADGGCVVGGSCGSTHVDSARVEPNLIIALDRSCSMRQVIGGKSKWQSAVEAITGLTSGYQDQIRFGLTLFPDEDADKCGQGAIPVPIGDMNEAHIQSMLKSSLDAGDPLYPDGPCVTPIDTGVGQAATDPGLHDPAHPGFLVLITDGEQAGCNKDAGNADTLATITSLKSAGVSTFVIGFNAGAGGVDVPALNSFAQAGGEPAPSAADGGYKFFLAQDQASLEAALAIVGGQSMSCAYDLSTAPPDPSKLYVFFNDMLVTGWSYDSANDRVVFTGALCDELKNGQVMKLDVVYGCPGIN